MNATATWLEYRNRQISRTYQKLSLDHLLASFWREKAIEAVLTQEEFRDYAHFEEVFRAVARNGLLFESDWKPKVQPSISKGDFNKVVYGLKSVVRKLQAKGITDEEKVRQKIDRYFDRSFGPAPKDLAHLRAQQIIPSSWYRLHEIEDRTPAVEYLARIDNKLDHGLDDRKMSAVTDAIDHGEPVLMILNWDDRYFHEPMKWLGLKQGQFGQSDIHAVVAVGYTRDSHHRISGFYIQNSWGSDERYGIHFVTRDYLDRDSQFAFIMPFAKLAD